MIHCNSYNVAAFLLLLHKYFSNTCLYRPLKKQNKLTKQKQLAILSAERYNCRMAIIWGLVPQTKCTAPDSASAPLDATLSSCFFVFQSFDDFIFAFFAVEMVIKMIALGIFGKKCYLGDTWNRLDFFIVLAG